MMPKALVFSLPAARQFQAGVDLADDWSVSFQFGDAEQGMVSVPYKDAVFVFRSDENTIAPSIVIELGPNKLFSCFDHGAPRLEALKRSIQAGILVFDGHGEIPSYWRPNSRGQYITFQATSVAKGDSRRLTLWRRLSREANPCVFVFDVTEKQRDYDALNPDFKLLEEILGNRTAALASRPRLESGSTISPTTLDLNDLPRSKQVDTVTHGWKFSYLYQSRLTKRQLDFVDADLDRPIRLKGAAGTGKTLAMVAKLLREAGLKKEKGESYRFLFVTHNASAAELAENYARGLDEADLMSPSDDDQLISIDTLLGLAIRDLTEDLNDLQPISVDAHEGKKLQLFILSDVVDFYAHEFWVARKKTATTALRAAIEAPKNSPEHEEFCWELMNEIACVLDADGVRDSAIKRDAYLKDKRRPRNLMSLDTIGDREVILDLYDRYRNRLRKEGLISVDQLIADYMGFLDSFRWDARRQRMGYDAIFVDEYHLFNPLERATFPSLMRNVADGFPTILMALDPRQSPRTVLLDAVFGHEDTAAPFAAGQAKNLRDFEFSEVFRYTPEIAKFLSFVNQSFPEHDLSEEWLPGLATSALPSGEIPVARQAATQVLLFDGAVAEAERLIKRYGRGKVALLTLSDKSFDAIGSAGRYGKKLYVVDSRESLNRLQYVGNRIVFGMPEYVAGVQFDHVIVADVNEMDDRGRHTSMGRNRFGANLYVAVSRARYSVTLLGDVARGGLATVVVRAAENGLVSLK
jgi:hypothetical protein